MPYVAVTARDTGMPQLSEDGVQRRGGTVCDLAGGGVVGQVAPGEPFDVAGQLRPAGGWEGHTVGSESSGDGLPAESGLGGELAQGGPLKRPRFDAASV